MKVSPNFDDEETPKRKRRPRPLKEVEVIYRLRDPATGLFLHSAYSRDAHFAAIGAAWKTRGAAMRAWANYLKHRMELSDGGPLTLEIVDFEVKETLKGPVRVQEPPMAKAWGMIEAVCGNDHSIQGFMDALTSRGKVATHIFECLGRDLVPPSSGDFFSQLRAATSSFGPDDHMMIAAQTDKDAVYLKMELSDFIIKEWHIADIVRRYESGERYFRLVKRKVVT